MKSLVFHMPLRRSKCPSLLMSSEQDLKQLCFSYQSFICFPLNTLPILRCRIRHEVAKGAPIWSLTVIKQGEHGPQTPALKTIPHAALMQGCPAILKLSVISYMTLRSHKLRIGCQNLFVPSPVRVLVFSKHLNSEDLRLNQAEIMSVLLLVFFLREKIRQWTTSKCVF